MIAIDHCRGWWALEISRRCWALIVVVWFRRCCWLTEAKRWGGHLPPGKPWGLAPRRRHDPCHSAGTNSRRVDLSYSERRLGWVTAAHRAALASGLVLSTSRKRAAVGASACRKPYGSPCRDRQGKRFSAEASRRRRWLQTAGSKFDEQGAFSFSPRGEFLPQLKLGGPLC
jgi:hypothetical protein